METHAYEFQASVASLVFDGLLAFLPDWLAYTLVGLILALVAAGWTRSLVRKIQYRRAVRSGRPIHAAARYGQPSGAHFLGSYAPPAGSPGSPAGGPAPGDSRTPAGGGDASGGPSGTTGS